MQRLSVSQFSSYRWSFFQDVLKFSKMGFNSIGVWRQKVDDFGFEAAADLLFEMQMSVSSFSWAGGFTGSDGNSFCLAVDDGIEAVYQAHLVGAKKLIIHPGARNGHTESHAMRLIKTGLRELLPVATDLGIQLLLEPIVTKRNPWSFVHRCHSYRQILDSFCASEVGLAIDLFHVGNNKEFQQELPTYADRIELVQVSDAVRKDGEMARCKLGTGVIPITSWLNMLADHDYSGEFEIELHGMEFEDADYEQLLLQSQAYLSTAASEILSSTSSN